METESKANELSLHKKIVAVMSEIGAVAKDGKNTHSNFDFQSIDSIRSAIQPMLVNHGLTLIPNMVNAIPNEKGYLVEFEITLTCVDTGETRALKWLNEAIRQNSSDAMIFGKAMSYAVKYAIINIFHISCNEPDIDSGNDGQKSGQKSSKSGYSGKKTTGQSGGKKTVKNWTEVQANIDFVKSEGQKLKTTFGAGMVDRVKSGIKSGEQANAAAYIAAIRDGCEATKRIEDDIRLKNVQAGPFSKQVSKIIDVPTLADNPKASSGETFQLISLKYNPTAKQQPSWRALLKHGKEDIGISLYLEDAALLEYAAGVTIRETRHDILFDKPIDVILKYKEGKIFRLDSVYDGIEFINQDMKRKRLKESANQVLADIDKELMRV